MPYLPPTERDFTRAVIELARASGWLVSHFGNTVKVVRKRDGRTLAVPDKDAAGFPDLVCARRGRLVVAELKMPGKKPTLGQVAWLQEMDLVEGGDAYAWWPKDWDTIMEVLR